MPGTKQLPCYLDILQKEAMPPIISQEVTDDFIRTAFERCPSAIIVVDKAGQITIINQEVGRMLGYSRAELVGESVEKLVPEPFANGHAKLREHYASMPTQRRLGAGRELFARGRDLVNRILFFTRKHERVRGITSLDLPVSETIQLLQEIEARGISTLLSKPYLSTELITLVKRLVDPENR